MPFKFEDIQPEIIDLPQKTQSNFPKQNLVFEEAVFPDSPSFLETFVQRITDPQGVSWIEVPIDKANAKLPIEAFGAVPFLPQQEQE